MESITHSPRKSNEKAVKNYEFANRKTQRNKVSGFHSLHKTEQDASETRRARLFDGSVHRRTRPKENVSATKYCAVFRRQKRKYKTPAYPQGCYFRIQLYGRSLFLFSPVGASHTSRASLIRCIYPGYFSLNERPRSFRSLDYTSFFISCLHTSR